MAKKIRRVTHATSFSAAVDLWVKGVEERELAVFHVASAGVAEAVMRSKDEGGNLPVKTGNLRNSLAASRQGVPAVKWGKKDNEGKRTEIRFADNGPWLQAEIVAAKIGDSLFFGFQAPYAAKAERKEGFIRLAAQIWPEIVEESARAVKHRL